MIVAYITREHEARVLGVALLGCRIWDSEFKGSGVGSGV